MMNFLFELNVTIADKGSREISNGLYRQLKDAIVEGRLLPGSKLPPTRSAPSAFKVSRNTLQDVYDRLGQDGLVRSMHGSGTFVAPALTKQQANPDDQAFQPELATFWGRREAASWIGFWRNEHEFDAGGQVIDLRPALIDPAFFPHSIFRQAMARQLRQLEVRPPAYKSPQGNAGSYQLRRAVAAHIALTRAVACDAEDVLITSGAQQAFDLIARTLVKSGETVVAVEDPGYPPIRVPFAAAGARIVPVRVDSEGMVVDEIPTDARIICVCPSHQFPLGMAMSQKRRAALLEFARQNGAVIIEDDYDGEFRYEGSPLEALRTASSIDCVFYVGSFSKCMFPSIRLGFLVPPRWAMAPLVLAKNCADWHCSLPLQLAVASFILDGHLARHVRRVRRAYSERREHLFQLLAAHAGDQLKIIPSFYGMHIAVLASEPMNCEGISHALAKQGVLIHSLDRYFLRCATQSGFVLSYAVADKEFLSEAIGALGDEIRRSRLPAATAL